MSESKRCLILAACPVEPALKRYWRPGDWVIACDAGWYNADELNLRPDLVLGDFDSSRPPRDPEWPVMTLPRVKDDTDTHYAARMAADEGYDEVTILGGLGGARLDHTIANLCTGLYLARRGVKTLLADGRTLVQYLLPDQPIELRREDWSYFSLFPLEGTAEGVCVRGAAYPLEGARLTVDWPLGVSNAFEEDVVTLSVERGAVAVFCVYEDQ